MGGRLVILGLLASLSACPNDAAVPPLPPCDRATNSTCNGQCGLKASGKDCTCGCLNEGATCDNGLCTGGVRDCLPGAETNAACSSPAGLRCNVAVATTAGTCQCRCPAGFNCEGSACVAAPPDAGMTDTGGADTGGGCPAGEVQPDLWGIIPEEYTQAGEGAWIGLLTRGESTTLADNHPKLGMTDLTVQAVEKVSFGPSTGIVYATIPKGTPAGKSSLRFHTKCASPQMIAFTVISGTAPAIDDFSPTSGPDGTEVTLTGSNFMGVDKVQFRAPASTNIANTFSVVSATSMKVKVPSVSPGVYAIWVHSPAGWATNVMKKFTEM